MNADARQAPRATPRASVFLVPDQRLRFLALATGTQSRIAPSPIRREIGGSSACHIEPVCQSETRLGPVLPGKGLPALLGHRITLEGDAEFLDVLYPSGNLIKNSSDHIHRYAGWMGKLPVNVTHEDEPPPSGQLS